MYHVKLTLLTFKKYPDRKTQVSNFAKHVISALIFAKITASPRHAYICKYIFSRTCTNNKAYVHYERTHTVFTICMYVRKDKFLYVH